MKLEKPNLYLISTHPIQYMVPLYQEIEKSNYFNFNVFYCSEETVKGGVDKHFGVSIKWDIPLIDGYNNKFLKNNSPFPSINNGFFGVINFGLVKELYNTKKGLLVVTGWLNLSYLMAIVFGKLFGHKVCLRCEASILNETKTLTFKSFLRKIILGKLLFKLFIDFFLYIGKNNKGFYEYFGVNNSKLFPALYAVDNKRFSMEASQIDKEFEKTKLGFQKENFIILFTGKLYDIKRPFDLLKAFQKIDNSNVKLIFVGDGVLKSDLLHYISENNITGVTITGFINQTSIPIYYAISDVIVLCSESETWGLSINEALNFGLPAIVNNTVGCAADIIKEGQNGFVVSKGNIEELTEKLNYIINKEDFRIKAKEISKSIISHYNYNSIVNTLIEI